MGFALGDPVRVEMEKWGRRRHWHFDALWLGTDRHGDWIGLRVGTTFDRPGARFVSTNLQVGLSPAPGLPEDERWWVGTFHGPGGNLGVSVYVDVTTPPVWDDATLRMVDLDLDVLRGEDGRVWVDDEDEFALHQVELGYPADVVRSATRSCERVHSAMTTGVPPHDGSHERWLRLLTDLNARR